MLPKSTPLTVWWGIPCKSVIPLFREIARRGYDVQFVSVNPMSPQRVALGWKMPDHYPMRLEVLGDDWQCRVAQLIQRPGLHIFNGIWHDSRINFALNAARRAGRDFGLIMEAPSNLERGLRRVAKKALAPTRARLLVGKIPQEAQFVMSASGEATTRFRRLGFSRSKIYRFGYFPEFPHNRLDARKLGPLRLLCVGYLEPFKGQDLLIAAIARLRQRGIACQCTITGFGSMREILVEQARGLGVDGCIDFVGVVEQTRLEDLFAESDILVAPGYEEPWGIRVNEALLAGLPVVVSDRVGAQEIIVETGAGAIFKSGSATSLTHALEQMHGRLMNDRASLIRRVDSAADAIRPAHVASYALEVFAHAVNGASEFRPVAPWIAGAPAAPAPRAVAMR